MMSSVTTRCVGAMTRRCGGARALTLATSGQCSRGVRPQHRHMHLAETKQAATTVIQNSTAQQLRDPNPEMVDARHAPSNFVSSSAVVYQEFATVEEADVLVKDIQARLKRRRYEKGHWDSVIINYKETELFDEDTMLSLESQTLLDKVRYQLKERHIQRQDDNLEWLPCHAIDLHKEGQLTAHVDSIRFSGDLVAGLSLLSPSIMRLIPDDDGDAAASGLVDHLQEEHGGGGGLHWVDMYLPPRSLYVLSDAGRYHYSHQLLPSGSVFGCGQDNAVTVERDHRLSVIFRDSKPDDGQQDKPQNVNWEALKE